MHPIFSSIIEIYSTSMYSFAILMKRNVYEYFWFLVINLQRTSSDPWQLPPMEMNVNFANYLLTC